MSPVLVLRKNQYHCMDQLNSGQLLEQLPLNNLPLVSVICLCFNHEKYVEEAIQSVFDQNYANIELIVVDDASSDGSSELIEKILENSSVEFIKVDSNLGNTKAFNLGFFKSTGKYIIDLAADDILVKDRIERQVSFFEGCKNNIGVIYSDAIYIDESGKKLITHFGNNKFVPYSGEIYEKLISNYFIPHPSMMIKREVLLELNGYDEKLAYEDFDFWIRSSRKWQYQYQSEILTKIRKTVGSLSSRVYSKNDKQLHSTYLVCKKNQIVE